MCFGPIASFTASGILVSIGTMVIRNIRFKQEIWFAAFPLLCPISVYLFFSLIINPVSAVILNGSLHYETYVAGPYLFTGIYIAVTILPYFLSSHRGILVFGLPNLVFCVIAYAFYHGAFVSVWCFFAAVLSLSLYFFLKKLHHQPLFK